MSGRKAADPTLNGIRSGQSFSGFIERGGCTQLPGLLVFPIACTEADLRRLGKHVNPVISNDDERSAAKRRRIIRVTHNAKLVVNTDFSGALELIQEAALC